MPRGDLIVASEDDRLVGSTTARTEDAMPHGDSSTPVEGNSAGENISARLQSSTPREDTARLSDFKPLPRHLMLQLDNFSKENKNQTMIAFGSDLVARGVLETITFFFLIVGHTHEDIDAFFSKVAS
jgi:hypothetical protein